MAVMSEMKVSQEDVAARAGMARGQRQDNIAVQAEQGAVARRQD